MGSTEPTVEFYCAIATSLEARNRPVTRCQAQCLSCQQWRQQFAQDHRDDASLNGDLSPSAPHSAMSETEHE